MWDGNGRVPSCYAASDHRAARALRVPPAPLSPALRAPRALRGGTWLRRRSDRRSPACKGLHTLAFLFVPSTPATAPQLQERMEQAAEELAEDMVHQFEDEMGPVVENIEAAMEHFGDIDGLLEGPQGFDLSSGVWQESGWREFQRLRRQLEHLRELRDLVRAPAAPRTSSTCLKARPVLWGQQSCLSRIPMRATQATCKAGSPLH